MTSPDTSTDTTPLVLREVTGPVCILTLNRPAARNSLSLAMIAALQSALAKTSVDNRIRVIVLAASGPVFCAGHDLKEMTAHRADADRGHAFFHQTFHACATLMQAIGALPKPVIAAVTGVATAAGCQLVATCDLAVASSAARFVTPGVDIGLFCSTPMVALSRAIGRKQALEMLLTGDAVDAAQAQTMGLINRIAAPGTELDEALALAKRIAAKSPAAIKAGKTAFYKQTDMNLADAYQYATKVMTENMLAPDAVEGIAAFLEKRAPQWHEH